MIEFGEYLCLCFLEARLPPQGKNLETTTTVSFTLMYIVGYMLEHEPSRTPTDAQFPDAQFPGKESQFETCYLSTA